MLGKAVALGCPELFGCLKLLLPDLLFNMDQVFLFQRAHIENGIFIRTARKNRSTNRNESILMDVDGNILQIEHLVALVDRFAVRLMGTYACGYRMDQQEAAPLHIGTRSVHVPHIFLIKKTGVLIVTTTLSVTKQLVILGTTEAGSVLVSPPSNRFRPT